MNIRTTLATATVVVAMSVAISALAGWWPFFNKDEDALDTADLTEILWDDLIPDDFVQPENPFNTMMPEEIDKLMDGSDESNAELARLQEAFDYAPVVDELDGKRVKLPAYITPLEYNDQFTIKEFLLVPYVGACIHSPPPPSNQIVHALSQEELEFKGLYDPVWAIGTIRTESVVSDLAESGYSLEVEKILPYEVQQ